MRFDESERRRYAEEGWVLRRGVLPASDVRRLREAVERVVDRVAGHARRPGADKHEFTIGDGHRLQLSSRTVIQWEWHRDSRQIRLLEPFTHLDPEFAGLWDDPRLTSPMQDAVGSAGISPFTCKLNLKRPREGSPFPWHQDYPYWYVRIGERARDVATAMLFLDDASEENGALRVLPGSHRAGPAPRDRGEPTGFLADPALIDASREVIVEAVSGSAIFFPSLLLHRSAPNTSDRGRRALLLSFQPEGRPRHETLPWRPERVSELP